MTMRPLRPKQAEAMDVLRRSLGLGKRTPMLAAPTGFGKTRVMAEIALGATAKGKRVLIVVPALSLVDQTVSALEDEGLCDIGVMQGLHERTDSAAAVQVASVQTLQRRKMPACDLVLIDEAHRWFRFFERMIADRKAVGVPVVGLSATPWTKSLGKHFDDLLQVTTTAELIDLGLLSKFRVYAPSHPDLADVRTVAGDYHEGELAEAMNKPQLVADVVTTWLQHGERRPTLCFAVDRAHAKQLQVQFDAACVRTGYIDAHTPRDERAKVRHSFQTGEIEVVCNVGCLTTGVDWDVRCIILARPTKSEMLFVQIIGRGLRTVPGKTDCLILDHSDTHLNLGLVTDIRHDKLDDGKKRTVKARDITPKPRECSSPTCSYLRPAKVSVCPACGFKAERQADVEVHQGELVQFERKAKNGRDDSVRRRASVYGQLLWLAEQNGNKTGWAAHKFKEYFGGSWPNDVSFAKPEEPQADILMWVKSRRIAYAQAQGRILYRQKGARR